MSKSSKKGEVLEELVAMLHRVDGVDVSRRVKVSALSGNRADKREIDVLLSGSLCGYPVRWAVECKNIKSRVKVETVDSFVGKLSDVGIPSSYGIMVSAAGFTKPALSRAADAGIRCLSLEGLTPDRLSVVVQDAFQSTVYVTLQWEQMQHFPVQPSDSPVEIPGAVEVSLPRDPGEPVEHWALWGIWEAWTARTIPSLLGSYTVIVRPVEAAAKPVGASELVIASVKTHGLVFTRPGELRVSRLRNAATRVQERAMLKAKFGEPANPSTRRLESEQALSDYARTGAFHVVVGRIRVPRLEMPGIWFPISEAALKKIADMRGIGKLPKFDEIEGLDIRRAWDPHISRDALIALMSRPKKE